MEALVAGVCCDLAGALDEASAEPLVLGGAVAPPEVGGEAVDVHLSDHGGAGARGERGRVDRAGV